MFEKIDNVLEGSKFINNALTDRNPAFNPGTKIEAFWNFWMTPLLLFVNGFWLKCNIDLVLSPICLTAQFGNRQTHRRTDMVGQLFDAKLAQEKPVICPPPPPIRSKIRGGGEYRAVVIYSSMNLKRIKKDVQIVLNLIISYKNFGKTRIKIHRF